MDLLCGSRGHKVGKFVCILPESYLVLVTKPPRIIFINFKFSQFTTNFVLMVVPKPEERGMERVFDCVTGTLGELII